MTSNQKKSIALTLTVHGIIALLMLLLNLTTPDPPFPEGLAGGGGGGSFVEFGTMDISDVAPAPTPAPTPQPEEEIMTNDDEQTVSIDQPEKTKNKPVKKEKEKVKVKEQPKVKVDLVEVPKVNQNALFKGGKRNTGGTVQGSGDGGGLGDGNGTGKGPGTGSGDGGGNGSGSGKGDGFGFDLTGRGIRSTPKVEDNSQEQGKVVIDIRVDKNGNVISAEGPARGSTTTSANLVRKSKEAAFKVKFTPSSNDVEVQKGTMTFRFILK
ncbi:MAG: hypothetical protein ACKOX3_04065 [Bacteroidota bacterium]